MAYRCGVAGHFETIAFTDYKMTLNTTRKDPIYRTFTSVPESQISVSHYDQPFLKYRSLCDKCTKLFQNEPKHYKV